MMTPAAASNLRAKNNLPAFDQCYVVSVSGDIKTDQALHQAINHVMLPHSESFVFALVDSVREQKPITASVVQAEAAMIREYVCKAGDEHGMSGSSAKVSWLSQKIDYLSCIPEFDPTKTGQSHVAIHSVEINDPRAYRDVVLTITPNQAALSMGIGSILESAPTFLFNFGVPGTSDWKTISPMLSILSSALPQSDWNEFDRAEVITTEGAYKGCIYANTKDGVSLVLKPMKAIL